MARSVSKTWESEIAYNHGVADERERIIKLLEGEQCPPDEDLVECWCGSYIQAIALIKGENK
jgi:hypothetical protein